MTRSTVANDPVYSGEQGHDRRYDGPSRFEGLSMDETLERVVGLLGQDWALLSIERSHRYSFTKEVNEWAWKAHGYHKDFVWGLIVHADTAGQALTGLVNEVLSVRAAQ